MELVEDEVQKDPALQKIMEELTINPDSHRNYTLENGRLHYKGQMVLSTSSSWIPKLLCEYHTTPMGEHSGIFCTYKRIAQSLHWIGMKKTIIDFIATCYLPTE